MYAKYQLSMCPAKKIMANFKFGDKQTNRQTDRRGKNNMPPRYVGGAGIKSLSGSGLSQRSHIHQLDRLDPHLTHLALAFRVILRAIRPRLRQSAYVTVQTTG